MTKLGQTSTHSPHWVHFSGMSRGGFPLRFNVFLLSALCLTILLQVYYREDNLPPQGRKSSPYVETTWATLYVCEIGIVQDWLAGGARGVRSSIGGILVGKDEDKGLSAEKRLGDRIAEIKPPGFFGKQKVNLDVGQRKRNFLMM
jgi:hypothetical protein